MPPLFVLPSLVIGSLRQRSQNGTFQHQARRQPEAGRIEEPQQAVVGPIGLRLQRLHSLLAHELGEAVHRGMADAMLPAVVLDADRVEHDSREHGVGHALMDGLTKLMREKGVQSLQSQADWTNHGLLRFFDSSGFGLAPRLVLERSVLTPLAEAPDDE